MKKNPGGGVATGGVGRAEQLRALRATARGGGGRGGHGLRWDPSGPISQ